MEIQPPQKPDLIENGFLSTPITRPALFSPQECERILAGRSAEGRPALIQRDDASPGVDAEVRKATSYQLEAIPENYWIWERLGSTFVDVNQRFFKFQFDRLSPLAVMEYRAGDFYDSHVDIGLGRYSCRKLSCVLFLSPEQSYTGGRLLFGPDQDAVVRAQGAAVFFPSFMLHQVEPIADGLRHTLVCWALGNAFS